MKLDWKILLVSALLIVLSLVTQYEGSTDVGDYADASKYFAGEYSAAIRNSHSYVYGYVHAPFVALFKSYFPLKLSGLLFLFLLVYSVYWMTRRNNNVLWLLLLSPAVWYSGPWIGPLGIASLSLLWGWWHLRRFTTNGNWKDILRAGILLGLGISFWHTLLFFTIILGGGYLIDKRSVHGLSFVLGILVGLVPLLLLDWHLFGLPGYTLLKTMSGTLIIMLGGSVSAPSGEITSALLRKLLVLLVIPLSTFFFYRFASLRVYWREALFLGLSFLVIFSNPQLRYMIIFVPVALVMSHSLLPPRFYRVALLLSGLLSVLFVAPYVFQTTSSLTSSPAGIEITGVLEQWNSLALHSGWEGDALATDLATLAHRYPEQRFLVGPEADSYQILAHLAWNLPLTELVSIQDYRLAYMNETSLYQKTIRSHPLIRERRLISLTGTLEANPVILQQVGEIRYALGIDAPVAEPGFRFVEQEGRLYLSRKE